jgi:tetratricopeptide (TPR) repeat protein
MRGIPTAVFIGLMLISGMASAEPVNVRAAKQSDFGRIVFTWKTPVGHRLSIRNDRITLRFDRPIEATYQRVLATLSRYISKAVPEADGRGVQFTLKAKYDAYSYDSGASIFVEIAETPETAGQPDPPTETAKQAPEKAATPPQTPLQAPSGPPPANLPSVGVRGGAHPDYTRVVFDWPSKVDYSFSQEGGLVTIRFARPVDLDIRKLTRNRPQLLGGVVSKASADATHVALSVPPTSNVRHFLSGSKVVVDIRQPTGSRTPAKLPEDVLASVAPKVAPVAEPQSVPAEAPATAPSPAPSPGAVPVAAVTTEPIIADKAPSKPVVAVPGVAIGAAAGTALKSEATKLGVAAQQGAQPQPAPTTADAPASPAGPVTPLAVVTDPNLEEAEVTVSENPSEAGGMDLRFDWKEPVAAAVFRRVGKLWVAFDAERRVDIEKIIGKKPDSSGAQEKPAEDAPPPPPNLSKQVYAVNQLQATGGTVLRMSTAKDINPILRRDGFSWILTFRKQPLEPKTPLEVNAQPNSPVGARVFIPTPEPGRPIGVTDPDVGDNMVIVPLIPLSHGIAREYRYPEIHFPQTGQGVLVLSNTDNLRVRPLRQGVELTSAVPLSISSVTAEEAAGSKLGAIGPVSRLLDLERWELPDPNGFVAGRQDLQGKLARARGTKASQEARWNLANFYFANGYTAETLGVLRRMVAEDPEFEKAPELKLVRGGAKYLMARYGDAAEDLADPSLDEVDEGAFWRAAVIAKSGQMVAAAHELRRTGTVTQPYPKPIRFPLALLVAEAAIEIGDIENAQKFLEALSSAQPTTKQRAEIAYLEGKLAEVGGDEDGAVAKWEEAMEIDDRATLIKATYARMELLMQMQRMDEKEAIEILERLRYLWRGDEFEFKLLRQLGAFYLKEHGYRNGLEALRQAATYYREHEEAALITQQMSDTFNFLYLKDGADRMAPVTAIALYEEFRELTPAGRKGDEMIRKLADRLVGVDLLDQAAELLDGQVRFRLKGVEKAQVGTSLALVHAIARDYDSIIEVLDETRVPGIPDELAERRRHLRAYALVGQKQSEEATLLLKKDKTFDADLIRAEMFWLEADWTNASQFLRRVVRGAGIKPGQALDDEQSIRVLNLAAAYTLSGNERALVRLRSDYGPAMEASRFKEAFQLVAAPLSVGLISPTSIKSRVKTVTSFRSFLDKYKEQLSSASLSSVTRVGRELDEDTVPPVEG